MGKCLKLTAFVGVVALGVAAGYRIATDSELRERMARNAKDLFYGSKQKMNEMTEEVALRTARMTKNPKINQEWVEKQWDAVL